LPQQRRQIGVFDKKFSDIKSKSRSPLRRSDAITYRLKPKLHSPIRAQNSGSPTKTPRSNRGSSKTIRLKQKGGGGPTTPKATINEDYFQDQMSTLRKVTKKKTSLYDQAAADFVAINEYQSAVLKEQHKSKKAIRR
jgi:hypothetical protein